jgi:hypothetical protein
MSLEISNLLPGTICQGSSNAAWSNIYTYKVIDTVQLQHLVTEYTKAPVMGSGRVRADVWADILELVGQ